MGFSTVKWVWVESEFTDKQCELVWTSCHSCQNLFCMKNYMVKKNYNFFKFFSKLASKNGVFPKWLSLNPVIDNIFVKKGGFKPTTSCTRDRDDITVPWKHRWQRGSLNWPWFMPQWFIGFPEFTEFSESSTSFRKNSNIWLNILR